MSGPTFLDWINILLKVIFVRLSIHHVIALLLFVQVLPYAGMWCCINTL